MVRENQPHDDHGGHSNAQIASDSPRQDCGSLTLTIIIQVLSIIMLAIYHGNKQIKGVIKYNMTYKPIYNRIENHNIFIKIIILVQNIHV